MPGSAECRRLPSDRYGRWMPDRQDSMLPSPGCWLRWRIGGSTRGGNQRREVETGRFQCDDGRGEDRMQRSRNGQRMRGFGLQLLPSRCYARVAGKKDIMDPLRIAFEQGRRVDWIVKIKRVSADGFSLRVESGVMYRTNNSCLTWRWILACFVLLLAIPLSPDHSRAQGPCGRSYSQSIQYPPIYDTLEESNYWRFSHLSAIYKNERQGVLKCLYYELCNLYPEDQGRPLIASWPNPIGFGTAARGLRQSTCLALEKSATAQSPQHINATNAPIFYGQSLRTKAAVAYTSVEDTNSSSYSLIVTEYEGREVKLSMSHFVSYEGQTIANQLYWSSDTFWIGFVFQDELENFIENNNRLSFSGNSTVTFVPLREGISDDDINTIFRALDYNRPDDWTIIALGRNGDAVDRSAEPVTLQFDIMYDPGQWERGEVLVLVVEDDADVVAWTLLNRIGRN